jgi:SAM-dependent methyltransferase
MTTLNLVSDNAVNLGNSILQEVQMLVCPDCKGTLADLKCSACGRQFLSKDGFPVLLSQEPQFKSAGEIGDTYDDIYANRSGVWEDQGRTPEFIAYFSQLLAGLSTDHYLEIGCGEGFLLSRINAQQKAAIDLSSRALKIASTRSQAEFSVALAERLPFPSNSFDLVASVGVMEHFLNDREATSEIFRVLKPGGHYVALIHVDNTVWEAFQQKFRQFIFPRPHPGALLKYISSKIIKPISQPIQRPYTVRSGQACLEDSGFIVKEAISTRTHRDVPLVGPHVVIYVGEKPQPPK